MKQAKGNDRGFIIVIAMIALMAMSFFLLTGAMTSSSAVKISGNYVKTVDTFNIAEAGIAKARPFLENTDFDVVLTNYASTPLIPETPFNGGTYTVTVTDDANDGDSVTTNDLNGIIKVVSVGKTAQGGKVTISTHVQLIGGSNPIDFPPSPSGCGQTSCESASVMCGPSDVTIVGTATVDGGNYDYPSFTDPGSATATLSTTDPQAGNYDIIGSSTLSLSGTATTSQNVTESGCTGWQTFYNQWASVTPDGVNIIGLTGTQYLGSGNSCDDPKIYIINTDSATYKFAGDRYLCGTFIVASSTTIEMQGNVTLVGAMIMMGDNSALNFQTGGGGTPELIGKIVFKSILDDPNKEMNVKGTAKILYSASAMNAALQAINEAGSGGGATGDGTLFTAAWEETY
jgi:Tfp pilus assembly protein PilX